jgi:two-component sensor histidine kinase
LHAKARAHDLLSEAAWTELPLREVILAQLAPQPVGNAASVTVSGPPVLLKPRAALFLSMVFHELTANAVKYGALSVPDGRIEACWVGNGNPANHLQLTWTEHGGPGIERLTRRGFGTELIEKGIEFELQGHATLEIADGGLQCRISVPARFDLLTFGTTPPRPSRMPIGDGARA